MTIKVQVAVKDVDGELVRLLEECRVIESQ